MNDFERARTGTPAIADPRIFVVVPAYNESTTIHNVVNRLSLLYRHIVVVDDGSTDGTCECVAHTGVYLLRHVVNRGQGAALQTGISFALEQGADIVVTFDADGQHDEQDIKVLLAPILSGNCDVALGSRFLGCALDIPMTRLLVLKAGILFTRWVSRIRVSDTHNGLRAFSRQSAQMLKITIDGMGHASEILDQVRVAGWRYKEVPVTIKYSAYSVARGQSSWNALLIGSQILIKKLSQ